MSGHRQVFTGIGVSSTYELSLTKDRLKNFPPMDRHNRINLGGLFLRVQFLQFSPPALGPEPSDTLFLLDFHEGDERVSAISEPPFGRAPPLHGYQVLCSFERSNDFRGESPTHRALDDVSQYIFYFCRSCLIGKAAHNFVF